MNKSNPTLKFLITLLRDLAIREHFMSNDKFESCDASKDGNPDNAPNVKCNCGSEVHNKKVEEVMNQIREYLVPDEKGQEETDG